MKVKVLIISSGKIERSCGAQNRKNMESANAKRVVGEALKETGLETDNRPRLLSDKGSCYISQEFKKFIN